VAELRWLLLVLGLTVVAGIYLYTRFKPRLDREMRAIAERREPKLDDRGEVPVAFDEPVSSSASPLEPEVLSEPEPPPVQPVEPKIVTIRMMARPGPGFAGDKLVLKMRELGLQHGEFGIFHRVAEDAERCNEFSVASLIEPGSFDLTRIKSDTYPGVSIFMMLPSVRRDGVAIFDDMMSASRSLANELDGELLDEEGSSLSVQRERYLREEIIEYERQGTA
jgi:cell division protein ZipA